jgi:ABC-type transporter Mla subunit MlaD
VVGAGLQFLDHSARPMRRIALAAVLGVALVAAAILLTGAGGRASDPYQVRAIFDNASEAATGEEVRIAGAPVGTIVAEDVTAGMKAAVTIEIDNRGFAPFHTDATCAIRVQSLIGEKFVDCTPGTASYPTLPLIRRGAGAGTHYLPVTQTRSPVDFDIVQDIYRQPVREQFALILNELGAGLAARGADLNAVIHRADPALAYTDQVLKILAAQNRQLAQLSTDSNTVLTPLAKAKRELASFIVHANITSVASAARAADIARSFQLLPGFLRQLRPLMADLGSLASQGTPVFGALAQAAPSINRQYQLLAPFANATRVSLIKLGAAAAQQQPLLLASTPLARRLLQLGNATLPSAISLDRLTASLNNTGAIEQLMALLFNGTQATNGFDAVGHYIRTEALIGGCTGFVKVAVLGCEANFSKAKVKTKTKTKAAADVAVAAVDQTSASRARSRPSPALGSLLAYLIGRSR